jgi:unsaturated chondroitin disaccharide hydrolase
MRETLIGISCLAIGFSVLTTPARADLSADLDYALDFAEQQLAYSVSYLSTSQHARSTLSDGAWRYVDASDWTSGFFAGSQWLMYQNTSSSFWRTRAEAQTSDLEGQKYNKGDHDIGFRIMCSYGNGYRLTQNPIYKGVILTAAQSLATRYNAKVGCIRSWSWGSWKYPVIIDNMMNLELLFWASANGGNAQWYNMAVSHAVKTMRDHVRADGSTYHVVDYNPNSGAVRWRGTHAGYADWSTWARGQAWGLYGFTMSYRYTNDSRFLNTARRLADYYISHVPGDGVPYWDFNAPNIPIEPRDTSSAAIAASGLLELSTFVSSQTDKDRYRQAASNILTSLCSAPYLTRGSSSDGVLLHGVGNKNGEVDVSLIYGDYYFIETILRFNGYW